MAGKRATATKRQAKELEPVRIMAAGRSSAEVLVARIGTQLHGAAAIQKYPPETTPPSSARIACEIFHKARLPPPPAIDIFPRDDRRGLLSFPFGVLFLP